MNFAYVDRILSLDERRISGVTRFGPGERLRELRSDGDWIRFSAVSEAVGQLSSWHAQVLHGFKGKPVFLFAEGGEFPGAVPAGAEIEMVAEVHSHDDEVYRWSGFATCHGALVARIRNAVGRFMPIDQLECTETVTLSYRALRDGSGRPLETVADPYPLSRLMGTLVERSEGQSLESLKLFSESEPFFVGHFPRFPVVPAVVLEEAIVAASQAMMPSGLRLTLREVGPVKIRSFVRPGDACSVRVERRHLEPDPLSKVCVAATVLRGDRRIVTGTFFFQVEADS